MQFPVLRASESDTGKDQRCRIVFRTNRGLPGVSLSRTTKKEDSTPAWFDVQTMLSGTVKQAVLDSTQPGDTIQGSIVSHTPGPGATGRRIMLRCGRILGAGVRND